MASQYHRLIDSVMLKPNMTQSLRDAYDAGAFKQLEVQVRVLKSGTGTGNLKLQHAAVNEEDAYVDITGATWSLSGAGGFTPIPDFLRFIRWVTDNNVQGDPIVIVDIVAKE